MAAEIVTPEDLRKLKEELLSEIKNLMTVRPSVSAQWLKAKHVRKLLNISPGTLQQLRNNGTLPFSKIGGVTFYDAADIEKMFNSRKQNIASEKRKTRS